MKRFFILVGVLLLLLTFGGCISDASDASVASSNLSRAADQFEIYRRVIFYNGITDTYLLSVEGFCSITVDNLDNQLELTVKTGEGTFFKHYLGLSDNVTYFAEQIDGSRVSANHYRVIFKPSTIVPNIDIE